VLEIDEAHHTKMRGEKCRDFPALGEILRQSFESVPHRLVGPNSSHRNGLTSPNWDDAKVITVMDFPVLKSTLPRQVLFLNLNV
jgi:hypothetical protein